MTDQERLTLAQQALQSSLDSIAVMYGVRLGPSVRHETQGTQHQLTPIWGAELMAGWMEPTAPDEKPTK